MALSSPPSNSGWSEPFLDFGDFNFLESYTGAVRRMMESERKAIVKLAPAQRESKAMRLEILRTMRTISWRSPVGPARADAGGGLRLVPGHRLAALLINFCIATGPSSINPISSAETLRDRRRLTAWRTRHADGIAHAGPENGDRRVSGHDYLAATAAKHSIFSDFHNISTLHSPRSELPVLPRQYGITSLSLFGPAHIQLSNSVSGQQVPPGQHLAGQLQAAATGQVYSRIPDSDGADVETAYQAARARLSRPGRPLRWSAIASLSASVN